MLTISSRERFQQVFQDIVNLSRIYFQILPGEAAAKVSYDKAKDQLHPIPDLTFHVA